MRKAAYPDCHGLDNANINDGDGRRVRLGYNALRGSGKILFPAGEANNLEGDSRVEGFVPVRSG